jgi:D-alanine transaminase
VSATLATAYLNGKFLPIEQVSISPLDRGFLFGDAIYEVIPFYDGEPVLLDAHLQRLYRNLEAMRIFNPQTKEEWSELISELASRNGGGNIAIYLQISRGADVGRDHVFPDKITPTVFAMASTLENMDYAEGTKAITLPDNRWGRCDIKATALLANVLARQDAREAGAIDAILIWDGLVTEGAVSSVIIVENGDLIRRPHGPEVLPGTTTDHVFTIARDLGLTCRDEMIPESRLRTADEIWLTGATKGIAPVVQLDEDVVGDGRPGPVWRKVREAFGAGNSERS